MDSTNIISLFSSIALIILGFYFKYTTEKVNEQKQMVNGYFKKNWYIFLIIGVVCLAFDMYRLLN